MTVECDLLIMRESKSDIWLEYGNRIKIVTGVIMIRDEF